MKQVQHSYALDHSFRHLKSYFFPFIADKDRGITLRKTQRAAWNHAKVGAID